LIRATSRRADIKQHVVELDVAVDDALPVAVVDGSGGLGEELSGYVLWEAASLADVGEDVAAGAELHNEDEVARGFKGVKKSDDVTMTSCDFLEDKELLEEFLFLG
jgi:hypothetical protein